MNTCFFFDLLSLSDVVHSGIFLTNLLYSEAWLGTINIPAVAPGMFSGGVFMKKYTLGVMGAATFAFGTSFLGYFLSLICLAAGCENSKVAAITFCTRYVMSGYTLCVCLNSMSSV